MDLALKFSASAGGKQTILHFEMNKDRGTFSKIGIKKMTITFKENVDVSNLKIGAQNAGRLKAPEIPDSTFSLPMYFSFLVISYDISYWIYLKGSSDLRDSPVLSDQHVR